MVKNVLITGGAGYIGSVVIRKLLEDGFNVQVLDNLLYGNESIIELSKCSNFKFIPGDIRNKKDVKKSLKKIDAVIHLAAIVGEPACNREKKLAYETNYEGTTNLVEWCKKLGVPRFLFASTYSNYGTTDKIADENTSLNPLSIYEKTKVDAEKFILNSADRNFKPGILRFATAFGVSPRMRFDLIVNQFCLEALIKKKIEVFGGNLWRSFIHISDIAQCLKLCLEVEEKLIDSQIYNVGIESNNYTKFQVAKLVKKYIKDTKIEITNIKKFSRDIQVSFSKVRKILGFKAKISVENGILEIKKFLESGEIKDPFNKKYWN